MAFTTYTIYLTVSLVYDGLGFWLCIKRFSKGKLAWWPSTIEQTEAITSKELNIILHQSNPRFVKIPKDFSPVKQS